MFVERGELKLIMEVKHNMTCFYDKDKTNQTRSWAQHCKKKK